MKLIRGTIRAVRYAIAFVAGLVIWLVRGDVVKDKHNHEDDVS